MLGCHAHLGVKGWVLDFAVDKDAEVVLDHEGLDVNLLDLLGDTLHQRPAGGQRRKATQVSNRVHSTRAWASDLQHCTF